MRTPRQILAEAHTIAVVGASRDPQKPAHWVPQMLQEQGWHLVPVNPHAERLFGEHVYARLSDVPVHVDVVQVFRPAAEAEELVREAAAIHADAIWLQLGITNPQAQHLAHEFGLDYVEDACMGMERALADMVHGGCKPACQVYHGIVPEAEPEPEPSQAGAGQTQWGSATDRAMP
jgi:predicted CoA-binding protein